MLYIFINFSDKARIHFGYVIMFNHEFVLFFYAYYICLKNKNTKYFCTVKSYNNIEIFTE